MVYGVACCRLTPGLIGALLLFTLQVLQVEDTCTFLESWKPLKGLVSTLFHTDPAKNYASKLQPTIPKSCTIVLQP